LSHITPDDALSVLLQVNELHFRTRLKKAGNSKTRIKVAAKKRDCRLTAGRPGS
jgi:hypothetical protein